MKELKLQKVDFVSGNIVDVVNKQIYSGILHIKNGKIIKIEKTDCQYGNYILPGFIDSHIHIESSMLTPSEFASVAVRSGTVGVVADPHEIANVLGVKGVEFMISQSQKTPFKFYFAAPSCVPATTFETSGAHIGAKEIQELIKKDEIKCLGEMMDFWSVVSEQEEVMAKISAAKSFDKPIDGHAPGVSGNELRKYIGSGISTDHECSNIKEALEKIELGMKILIREGSAAKDFEALVSLVENHSDSCMFSSDDKHPNDLVKGHVNLLVKRALAKGYDIFNILKCACVNPVQHYKLDIGLLQVGDSADFIQIDNFQDLNIEKTVINGKIVFENNISFIGEQKVELVNNFNVGLKKIEELQIKDSAGLINVIEVSDGALLTKKLTLEPKILNGVIISDYQEDILKIVVQNRYQNSPPAIGFIKGFGFKRGAIASSVAHDSHNIVAVGVDDEDILEAINSVIEAKGGLCTVIDDEKVILPLPIAGLMSDKSSPVVVKIYEELESQVKKMGSSLTDAFMTLSFMTLIAIPDLKLSDKGLFDAIQNKFIRLTETKEN